MSQTIIKDKEELLLEEKLKQLKITAEEYELIKKLIGKEPNEIELAMFSAMWSEHCAYKNSKPLLRLFPTTSQRVKVLAGPGENAGIIDVGEGIRIAFKIESHNRPTAIEPFQGATTGVGGILRDILTLGARPLAFFNSLHFGSPEHEHSNYLISRAVEGIAHYGNCTGIPTLGGQVVYDESYQENPLVNAMCVGVLEVDRPITSAARGIGNPIIYVGSETGRDGLGGAAFASSGLSAQSNKDRPAVQVGDPFMGKLLIESCLEAFKSGLVLASQDMGAAGLTCACCEMSAKGEVGIDLDLDLVPTRGELKPHEYLLSESQERMVFVAEAGKENELIKIFEKWNLKACVVGQVTDSKRVRIFHKGEIVADLPPEALTDNAPVYERKAVQPKSSINILGKADLPLDQAAIERDLVFKLSSPTFRSREWVYRQFDQQVGLNTLFKPAQADAALIRLRKPNGKISQKGLAVTLDCNPRYVKADPNLGSQIAMAEAARNIASIGATPLAITDNLNFGNPEKPESYWFLEESVKGIVEGCNQLDVPVVGGNVSLYNEFSDGRQILPTPVIGMVGLIEDYKNATEIPFAFEGDSIWLLGETFNESDCPSLDWQKEKALHKFLIENINNGVINSCHDLSEGGLLMALVESVIAGKSTTSSGKASNSSLGATIEMDHPVLLRLDSLLFGESQSRAIVTTSPGIELNPQGLQARRIGMVVSEPKLRVNITGYGKIVDLSKETLENAIKNNL
ncbi:MAG: phosphoribosylformylglycinamidine synthase subunit PurL [Candidatus Caenarcaniphilales bacterium]|nr:phosphoribosylformylglycinamidine synthase subunit PurL [Candidatus Caenarcaniphilales bacterium]